MYFNRLSLWQPIFLSKKDKTEALDSDIIAVNEKETLGAKGKRYNTGNKADNSAG